VGDPATARSGARTAGLTPPTQTLRRPFRPTFQTASARRRPRPRDVVSQIAVAASNGENLDCETAVREPDVPGDALFETGPFAEPAADDTRLQFQLRALETPFGLAYLGIIDILTQYGAAKVAENLCFGTLACGADISCQPPDRYARRFKRFIDAHVLKVGPETEGDKERGPGAAPLEIEASGESGTK
jgi:hypothetical protein